MNYKHLLIVILFGISFQAFSATITSTQTGDFDLTSTWVGGVVPTAADDIVIAAGHTVTFVANTTVTSLTINSTGILNNGGFTLTVDQFCTGCNQPNITINGEYTGSGTTAWSASIDLSLSLTFSGTGLVSTTGNWSIGTFSSTPTFVAGSNITFSNLTTLSMNCGVVVDGTITVSNGNISVPSGKIFTVNSTGVVNLTTGNLAMVSNGKTYNYGIITVAGNITGSTALSYFWNYANATVNIAGTMMTTGVLAPNYSGSVVNYNGAGNQTIKTASGGRYWSLICSNGGIKSLAANIEMYGDLTIQNNAQFDVVSTYEVKLRGNFINTSVNADPFVERSGTFSVYGTSPQTLSSVVAGGETFYDLFLFNTGAFDATAGLTLSNCNIIVTNLLTFGGNPIHTGSYEVQLTNTDPSSANNVSSDSYIDGNFRRGIQAAGGLYEYHIGNSDSYQLATLNISVGHSVGTILGVFKNYVAGTTGLPLVESGNTYYSLLHCGGTTPGTGNASPGIWTFTPNSGTATYDLTLNATNYSYGDIGTNTIAKRANSGSSWDLLGTVGSGTGSDPFVVNRTAYTGFSDFAILSAVVTLSIESIDISAKCQKAKSNNNEYGATVQWTTATEINSDYFIVEGSKDGFVWEVKDTIDGAGTNFQPTNYYYHEDFINPTPENETVVYYRVSQTDFDGVVNTYDILSCKCEASDKIKIHPVPSTESIVINFGDQNNVPNSFQITDMFGKVIEDVTVVGDKANNTSYTLDISNYASGRYIIKINDWKMKEDGVFIKK